MPNPVGPAFHALRLQDLVLWVHLGCLPEERKEVQEVRVSVEFRFKQMPQGVLTDQLEETICYAQVSSAIQTYCESREFKLIERMGFEIYGICKQEAGDQADIHVSIHKVKPPVERLAGGSHYRCGDFLI